jgi:hypothetical protein
MPYCRESGDAPTLNAVRPVRAHRRGAGRELARALGATRSPILAGHVHDPTAVVPATTLALLAAVLLAHRRSSLLAPVLATA